MTTSTLLSRRRWLLASTALAAAPGLARAADTDEAQASAAVAAFHQALAAGDAETAKRLLAPDAVVLEGGDMESREHYLAHHLAADIAFARAVRTQRGATTATVSGGVAWVSATSTSSGTYQGKALHLSGAELMVLSKTSAGWQIRAIHWSSHNRSKATP